MLVVGQRERECKGEWVWVDTEGYRGVDADEVRWGWGWGYGFVKV